MLLIDRNVFQQKGSETEMLVEKESKKGTAGRKPAAEKTSVPARKTPAGKKKVTRKKAVLTKDESSTCTKGKTWLTIFNFIGCGVGDSIPCKCQ